MDAVKAAVHISAKASRFSMPRKTLDDRIKGRVKHGSNPGITTVLSSTEEDGLGSYFTYMAERGFPLTCTMVTSGLSEATSSSGRPRHQPQLHGL